MTGVPCASASTIGSPNPSEIDGINSASALMISRRRPGVETPVATTTRRLSSGSACNVLKTAALAASGEPAMTSMGAAAPRRAINSFQISSRNR